MVELDTDAVDGVDIAIYWKLLIFVPIFLSFWLFIEFYRRKPFISFYIFTLSFVGFPLWLYSGQWEESTGVGLVAIFTKDLLVLALFVGISLWRISFISDDDFSLHFSGFKLNGKLRDAFKGDRTQRIMQNFLPIIVGLNILWAILV